MANIKSAKKRILVNQKKADINKSVKTGVKTAIKKVEIAVEKSDKATADVLLREAIAAIEKASLKNIYHKNNAARKVSRLTKLVNKMA